MTAEANDVGVDACSATPRVCILATTNQQGCSLSLAHRGRGPFEDRVTGRVLITLASATPVSRTVAHEPERAEILFCGAAELLLSASSVPATRGRDSAEKT